MLKKNLISFQPSSFSLNLTLLNEISKIILIVKFTVFAAIVIPAAGTGGWRGNIWANQNFSGSDRNICAKSDILGQ